MLRKRPLEYDSEADLWHSDVHGADAVFVSGNSIVRLRDGSIESDPLFVDPDGPDDDPGTWEDNNFHLGEGSPCVDAGDPGFV